MNLLQNARLLLVSGLYATLLLSGCDGETPSQHTPKPPPDEDNKPAVSRGPVCSTLTGEITGNCSIQGEADDPLTITYNLVSSREQVSIPVENGTSSITLHDAMVYNKSLLPERIELRRGDELRINYLNELSLPPDNPRFDELGDNVDGMKAWFSNLHTHGLVTPWDFKKSPEVRGDNVLGVLLDSKQQGLPPGIDPKELCSTIGDKVAYRYPISGDHEIGLNWYHPHPHGVTGFQVEGGMSGLLMIGDAQAEKLLNTTYLQLKDMQASKRADGSYQFEKFEPAVAGVCHDKTGDNDWAFDGDAPGRCNYHAKQPADGEPVDYSWLFLVNGELFPTIDLPKSAYLRIANSSANATYRLVLEPDAVKNQQPNTVVTYYTPPFKVVEKDGMTTTDSIKTDSLDSCTVAMTPATRVGVALDFEDMQRTGSVCELKVTTRQEGDGKVSSYYDVQHLTLDEAGKKKLAEQATFSTYTLIQEGIDTGEDDWPAVRLATLAPDDKLPRGNLAAYQKMLLEHDGQIKLSQRTDVKAPDDTCKPDLPPADADGINRHVALFFGGTVKDPDSGEFENEHFGLVAAGEDNLGTTVTADTIRAWRTEYLRQFAADNGAKNITGPDGVTGTLLEYGVPDLEAPALNGLVGHKFHINKDGSIKASICTRTSKLTERWRIHNLSAQIHNFHIHQMKYHVANVRGATCMLPSSEASAEAFKLADPATGYLHNGVTTEMLSGAMDEQCVKSYAELFHNVPASFRLVKAPSAPPGMTTREAAPTVAATQAKQDYGMHDTFPVPPMGYIDIELELNKAENVGEYVFHCHILEHEDAGMMGKLVVQPGPGM